MAYPWDYCLSIMSRQGTEWSTFSAAWRYYQDEHAPSAEALPTLPSLLSSGDHLTGF